MTIQNMIRKVLSVNWIKSFWLNIYYFGFFQAFRFPILLGYGVKVASKGDRGSVGAPLKFGTICFGLKHDPFALGYSKSYWNIGKDAIAIFKGTFRVSKGTTLNLFPGAFFSVGDGFTSNANLLINCMKSISIGDNCLFGWNITMMDSDGGHQLLDKLTDKIVNPAVPIVLGNHVWVGSEASILKGSFIPDGCVVGFKSNVCGFFENSNSAIVGNPAKVIKNDIVWKF